MLRALLSAVVVLIVLPLFMATMGAVGPWEFGLVVLVAALVGVVVARGSRRRQTQVPR